MKMRGFKLFAAVLTATMLSVTAAIPAAAYPNTAGHWTQSGENGTFWTSRGIQCTAGFTTTTVGTISRRVGGPCTATGWSFGTEDSTTSARSMTGALEKC